MIFPHKAIPKSLVQTNKYWHQNCYQNHARMGVSNWAADCMSMSHCGVNTVDIMHHSKCSFWANTWIKALSNCC